MNRKLNINIFVLIVGVFFFLMGQTVYGRGQDGEDGEDGEDAPSIRSEKEVAMVIKDMGGTPQKKKSPNISLTTFDGKEITLSDYRGRVLFITVWNSRCGFCQKEALFVVEMANTLDTSKIDFLGISIDAVKEEALQFVDDHNIPYQNVLDTDGKIIKQTTLAITGTPAAFIISPEGYIIGSFSGLHEWPKKVEALKTVVNSFYNF